MVSQPNAMDSNSDVVDADSEHVAVVIVRNSKFIQTGQFAVVLRTGETVCGSVESANALAASVTDPKVLCEVQYASAGDCYAVGVRANGGRAVMILSKALERPFVRRAYTKSGASGNVPWQYLATNDRIVGYLGTHFALSTGLRMSISGKADAAPKRSRPDDDDNGSKSKRKKRERTPSVSSSEEEEEFSDDDDAASIDLNDDASDDDEDLIEEDGGAEYSLSIKCKTPRAFRLAIERAHRAWSRD